VPLRQNAGIYAEIFAQGPDGSTASIRAQFCLESVNRQPTVFQDLNFLFKKYSI
jgi:hypothetical protein